MMCITDSGSGHDDADEKTSLQYWCGSLEFSSGIEELRSSILMDSIYYSFLAFNDISILIVEDDFVSSNRVM